MNENDIRKQLNSLLQSDVIFAFEIEYAAELVSAVKVIAQELQRNYPLLEFTSFFEDTQNIPSANACSGGIRVFYPSNWWLASETYTTGANMVSDNVYVGHCYHGQCKYTLIYSTLRSNDCETD